MRLKPDLDDIRFSYRLLSDPEVEYLEAIEFQALMRLVAASAAGLVWTYTEPSDDSLPDDDEVLARLTRMRKTAWRKVRPAVARFFVIARGRWHLDKEWISVEGGARPAIPLAIQAKVAARQGRRCTYCGDEHGPFEFDHIFPISRGGSDDPSNLTVACQRCNRSKQDLTLAEWMASGRIIIGIVPE